MTAAELSVAPGAVIQCWTRAQIGRVAGAQAVLVEGAECLRESAHDERPAAQYQQCAYHLQQAPARQVDVHVVAYP